MQTFRSEQHLEWKLAPTVTTSKRSKFVKVRRARAWLPDEQVAALARLTRAPACPLAASRALLPLFRSDGDLERIWISEYESGSALSSRPTGTALGPLSYSSISAAALSNARIDSKLDSKMEIHEEPDGGEEMDSLFGNGTGSGADALFASFESAPASSPRASGRRLIDDEFSGQSDENCTSNTSVEFSMAAVFPL